MTLVALAIPSLRSLRSPYGAPDKPVLLQKQAFFLQFLELFNHFFITEKMSNTDLKEFDKSSK